MTGKIIDFHSHILPKMDDGSKSVDQSLEMIRLSAEQGVSHIVLTPHFYADSDNPDHFLAKRNDRLKTLREALPDGSPELIAGAEVTYFDGMASMDDLPLMRVEGTKYLLVEMPFIPWTQGVLGNILDIQRRRDFTVVLAHVERYLRLQKPQTVEALLREGVQLQCNGDFFLHGLASRKAFRMLEGGWIHFLGSDAHNTDKRPPNLGEAYRVIEKKCGEAPLSRIYRRGMENIVAVQPEKTAEKANEAPVLV